MPAPVPGRRVVLLLALVTAVRVFLFSAAFPPFNNVDEEPHYDLVVKYAHGELPGKGLSNYAPESCATIALYRSTEFLVQPKTPEGDLARTPRWKRTDAGAAKDFATFDAHWRAKPNHESQSPPLYYAFAGLWYDLGRLLGIRGGQLVYWLRFLNVLVCASTVLLAHRFFVRHFPEHPLLHVGVPFLLAFLPQDVEYSINSDVLSAPIALLALDRLLVWTSGERPGKHSGTKLALATGLLVAAGFLVKSTNVVLVPVAAVVLWLRRRPAKELAVAAAAAAIPVFAWSLRTALLTGEPTGTGAKIQALGWTHKPLAQFLDHPILTPSGAWAFLVQVIRTSWRGEIYWHGRRMLSPLADDVYVGSVVVLVLAGTIALLRTSWRRKGGEREAAIACIATPLLSMLLLAVLSMSFDFGASFYPSRSSPFFTSGRLLSGALVPFLGVYVAGLEIPVAERTRRILAWTGLALVAAVATASEIWITADVFRSPFNWLHGPASFDLVR